MNRTFQEQQKILADKIVADLCNKAEYPNGLFPHTVFVEVEGYNGEPDFKHYKLISIEQSTGNCILECPGTGDRDEFHLSAIETDWLITVWGWCRDLMIEQKMWKEHAVNTLKEHTDASLDDILDFVTDHWQNRLPDADNIAAFIGAQLQPERELEYPLRRLLDVAMLEIPCFEQSMTFQICADALEKSPQINTGSQTPGKELFAMVWHHEHLPHDVSDEELLWCWSNDKNPDYEVERLTPLELQERINNDMWNYATDYVRFIEMEN